MRTHLQGTFLLIVLLLVFWAVLNWAGPVIDSALRGEDGAIVARASTESDEPGGDLLVEQDEQLDGNEVAELQNALIQVGYSPGPIDGILGELTRSTIDEAKEDLGLVTASDRRLLETLRTALEALSSVSDEPER